MAQQKQDSTQESIMKGEGRVIHPQEQLEEKDIPVEYILEFISRHHLNRLWEEFVYEKNHPKIPLSASEVLAMINMPPEEQERILKEHEYY